MDNEGGKIVEGDIKTEIESERHVHTLIAKAADMADKNDANSALMFAQAAHSASSALVSLDMLRPRASARTSFT